MIIPNFSRRFPAPRAFSLVETLLAAAVVGGALLTVLSLFTSGLAVSRESTRITYSALLARKLAEELSFVPSVPVLDPDFQVLQTDLQNAAIDLPLAELPEPQKDVRLYSAFLESVGMAALSNDVYKNGASDVNSTYLVLVTRTQRPDLGAGLQQLQINVEFPATAKAESRKVHRFSTLVHQP